MRLIIIKVAVSGVDKGKGCLLEFAPHLFAPKLHEGKIWLVMLVCPVKSRFIFAHIVLFGYHLSCIGRLIVALTRL